MGMGQGIVNKWRGAYAESKTPREKPIYRGDDGTHLKLIAGETGTITYRGSKNMRRS